MTDEVKYQVPLGWLGESTALPFVRSEVRKIFKHRRAVIDQIFPKNEAASAATQAN
jgi:hypothetical protein